VNPFNLQGINFPAVFGGEVEGFFFTLLRRTRFTSMREITEKIVNTDEAFEIMLYGIT
jgi:hypothetical protein